MKRFYIFIYLLILGALPVQLCAQVKFYSTISPKKIGKNEYTTLRIVIENANDIKNLRLPHFDGFNVVSGPNQESGMSSVNGNVTQHIAYSYILQPTSPGTKSLGPATATIGGADMRTNSLSIEVSARESVNNNNSASQNPFSVVDPFEEMMQGSKPEYDDNVLRKGETVQDKVSKNMQLRLETNKTECYVGEPVLATYKLYSRLKSESQVSQNPAFNGFSVVEMPDSYSTQAQEGTLNGKGCNIYTIRKAQLYPLQPGSYSLDAMSLENVLNFIKPSGSGEVDIFGRPAGQMINEKVTLSSKPVTVIVKALPEAGKPDLFKGAVGKFSIEAALAKSAFSTDESGMLNLIISGNGNLSLLVAPEIKWPTGIEAFDPKMVENFQKTEVPLSGSITYQYSFVVNKEGDYTIPPINFYYFDPHAGAYKTATTTPLKFSVTKGSGVKHVPDAQDTTIASVSKSKFYNKIFKNRSVLVSIIAFILLTALFVYLKKGKKKESIVEVEKAETQPAPIVNQAEVFSELNPLTDTEACLENPDCKDFYPTLNKELKQFLANKFLIPPQEVHSRKIAWLLDKKGVDNTLILQLEKMLENIEWQVYTPQVSHTDQKEFFAEADSLVKKINESCHTISH